MKVFVYMLHEPTLTSRSAVVERMRTLAAADEDTEFVLVDTHRHDALAQADLEKLVDFDPKLFDGKDRFKEAMRPLTPQLVSNALKHADAVGRAAQIELDRKHCHLILEDDAQFGDRLLSQVRSIVSGMLHTEEAKQWDVIFLGQPSNRSGTNVGAQQAELVSLKENCLLSSSESYLLSAKGARALAAAMFPVRFLTSMHLSYLIDDLQLDAFRVFPNLVGDGSKMGTIPSTLMVNNALLYNNAFKAVYMLLENKAWSETVAHQAQQILDADEHRDSPDMLHMRALVHKRSAELYGDDTIKRDAELISSELHFEKALTSFEQGQSPISNASIFMRNYIDIYRLKSASVVV